MARDARAIAEAMLNQALPVEPFERTLTAARLARTDADGPEFADPLEDIHVLYYAHTNDLRVQVRSLLDERNADRTYEIGKDAAEQVAQGTLAKLLGKGVVSEHYDFSKAKYGETRFGSGVSGQAPTEWVREYTWTIPRVHNGIPFANDSIQLSVHRSGSVSRIRSMRVNVVSTAGIAHLVDPNVDGVMQRFRGQFPNARLDRSGIAYALPNDLKNAEVEPQLIVSFSQVFSAEGREVISRREVLAYSLTAMAAEPMRLTPAPDPDATSAVPRSSP